MYSSHPPFLSCRLTACASLKLKVPLDELSRPDRQLYPLSYRGIAKKRAISASRCFYHLIGFEPVSVVGVLLASSILSHAAVGAQPHDEETIWPTISRRSGEGTEGRPEGAGPCHQEGAGIQAEAQAQGRAYPWVTVRRFPTAAFTSQLHRPLDVSLVHPEAEPSTYRPRCHRCGGRCRPRFSTLQKLSMPLVCAMPFTYSEALCLTVQCDRAGIPW